MKKLIFLFLSGLFFFSAAYSRTVDPATAKSIATAFFASRVSQSSLARSIGLPAQELQLELVHQEFDDSITPANTSPCFYIYNVTGNHGFVIVSGDDAVTPVLGYAFEGSYDPANESPAYTAWMNNYKKQIAYIRNAPSEAEDNSEFGSTSASTIQSATALKEVAPMVTSTWNQGRYYDSQCPEDAYSDYGGRALTGCAATAMGQVMYYHKYPEVSADIPAYYCKNYGEIAAIPPTTYNWSEMTNKLSKSSTQQQVDAVGTLLYHCGAAVGTNYGNDGSEAFFDDATYAFIENFHYSSSARFVMKNEYKETEWKQLILNELNNNRPVCYAGYDGLGGHAFVCDGYQTEDYLHFNWGWGGFGDGYFYMDALSPDGFYNFTDENQAIIGISPVAIPQLTCSNYELMDGSAGGTGNGDGIANSGETISVRFTLNNSGDGIASDVTAVLLCDDPDVILEDDSAGLGEVEPNSTASSRFRFSISSDCPDKAVTLLIKIETIGGTIVKEITLPVSKESSTKVMVAGTLNEQFTTAEKSATGSLTLTGTLDARDFKSLRDSFPALSELDLSGAEIVAYTGSEGTAGAEDIVYPSGVIPEDAFAGLSRLQSVILPDSITCIDKGAFQNCTGLTSMLLPDRVTSIADSAFYYCTGLLTLKISDSVTTIGAHAFHSCWALRSVDLGSGVTSIGDYAFFYCQMLPSIQMPNSVKTIGIDAFRTCIAMKSVTFGSGLTSIGSGAFYSCLQLKSVSLPDSVVSIGDMAFGLCWDVTSVTMGSKLTTLGSNAFSQCSSVKAFDVSEDNNAFCSEDGVLFSKDKRTLIAYAAASSAVYDIPAGVDSIGDYAFYFCNNLTTLTIPESVTSVGERSFQNCTRLSSFTLPGSLTSIAKSAFRHCRAFTTVAIPANVTSIDSLAFKCCKALTEIIVSADSRDFSSIDGVLFSKDKHTLLVYPCAGATTYILPDGVHSIAASAFDSCLNLTSVTILADITYIGSQAFYGCNGLTSIHANNMTPPALDSAVFRGVNTDVCTLYVPIGATSAYSAADQWGDFANIQEEVTSVPQAMTEGPTIYRKGDVLLLEGVEAGVLIAVYTENGILLQTVLASDNIVRIPLPAGQTYLISLDGKAVKVR